MNIHKVIILLFLIINNNIFAIRILSWNVENLFDTIDTQKKQDKILTEKEYKDKINLLSQSIKKINADFVGLCEIENIDVLKDLANKSNYPYFYLIEGNDPRGIDVAVMSKFAVNYSSNKNLPTPYKDNLKYKFSRDCTVSTFTYKNKQISILLTHLKSSYKNSPKAVTKRVAQAKGILDIINSIYQNDANPYIILMGDMNAVRYSETLNIFEKAGLKIMNYYVKEEKLYTYIYKGKKQSLDYIILNDKLFKNAKKKKIATLNTEEYKKTSDHYPLIFEFEL